MARFALTLTTAAATATIATAAPPYAPVAQWGLGPGALTNAGVNCSSDQYVAWNISSPRLHFCALAGLPAGQAEVFYRVGNGGADFSPVARFRTALAAGDATPFSFAVTGDMGIEFSQPTMDAVAAAAQAADLRFFALHNGDLAYADNRQSLNNGSLADGVVNDFYDMLSASYAASVPVLFGIGNHEVQLGDIPTCTANGSTCRGLAYVKRVAPTLPRSPSPFFYSWEHGLAHFVSISFESGWQAGGAQEAWLRADLAAVDRSATPWVVLYVHRPLYCSNMYSCNLTAPFLEVYEPLLYGADGVSVAVDVVFTSHVHCFERMYPVRGGALVSTSYEGMRTPLFLLQGSAGCLEGSTPWLPAQPAWSAFRACESVAFGFSSVDVLNSTHLRTSFVEAGDGRVLDSVTISKAAAPAPALAAAGGAL